MSTMKRVVRGITKPKPKAPETSFAMRGRPEVEPQHEAILRRQISIDPEGEVNIPVVNEERLVRALDEVSRRNRLGGTRNETPEGRPVGESGTITIGMDPSGSGQTGFFVTDSQGNVVLRNDMIADVDFSSIERRIMAQMSEGEVGTHRAAVNQLNQAMNRRFATGGTVTGRIANARIVNVESGRTSGYGDAMLSSCIHLSREWHRTVNTAYPEVMVNWQALIMMVRMLWPSSADEFSGRSFKDALVYAYDLATLAMPESVTNASDDMEMDAADHQAEIFMREVAGVLNRSPTFYLD
jgi:hypothetical protein